MHVANDLPPGFIGRRRFRAYSPVPFIGAPHRLREELSHILRFKIFCLRPQEYAAPIGRPVEHVLAASGKRSQFLQGSLKTHPSPVGGQVTAEGLKQQWDEMQMGMVNRAQSPGSSCSHAVLEEVNWDIVEASQGSSQFLRHGYELLIEIARQLSEASKVGLRAQQRVPWDQRTQTRNGS